MTLEEEAEDYANHKRIKDENTYPSFPDEDICQVLDYEEHVINISERIKQTYKDAYTKGVTDTCEVQAGLIHSLKDEIRYLEKILKTHKVYFDYSEHLKAGV